MKLLFIASESIPFLKTGGLGDVVGTLSSELAAQGHEVRVVIPLHKNISTITHKMTAILTSLWIQMGNTGLWCQVWEKRLSKGLVYYFVEYKDYFDRHPIYNEDSEKPYPDNGARFAFLSKAGLDIVRALNFKPDVVHCHDWQSALSTYYLKTWDWGDDFFKKTASVLTIHNMGYQGQVNMDLKSFIGLTSLQLRESEFEDNGEINPLKGGLFYADKITTVSPTYALEIRSEPGGNGLSQYLNRRGDDVLGILNGVKSSEWNPKTDKFLPANYDFKSLQGKAICKKKLQEEFDLKQDPNIPLFSFVGRLAYQKGLDLLMDCVNELLHKDLQLIILGVGNPSMESIFGDLPKWYPGKVGSFIGFDNPKAHRVEAGSDFFIMPSRYEPCGLNQMYSMIYGTIPIVRATGGLVDTVENYDEKAKAGTGFKFNDPNPLALRNTIGWALHTWYNNPEAIKMLQKNGMKKDFSWKKAYQSYHKVYLEALERRASW